MSTRRKRLLESSSPDLDDTAALPVVQRSSICYSYHSSCSILSRKRKNSSPGGSQDVKRRRVEEKGQQDGELQQKYIELYRLGAGGFGTVFAGFRMEDLLPVAIKHIPTYDVVRTEENLPLEVVLMQMVGKDQSADGGTSSFSVELLDWYELQHEVVLVTERPLPCADLSVYIQDRGCLQEEEAQVLLRQLVEGMVQIHSRGVLHRDLKPQNILVTETGAEGPRLRLLDFGSGCVLGEGPYTEFAGTIQYVPPEWFSCTSYQPESCTVWQILFDMLFEEQPFQNSKEIKLKKLCIPAHLSRRCKKVLRRCLRKDPRRRPSLSDLLKDPWLSSHPDTHT